MKSVRNLSPIGTHWHGTTIRASAWQLMQVMGRPAGGCSKTNYNWYGKTDEGQLFTVYDWKMGEIGMHQRIGWHIGGFNKAGEEQARREIRRELAERFPQKKMARTHTP